MAEAPGDRPGPAGDRPEPVGDRPERVGDKSGRVGDRPEPEADGRQADGTVRSGAMPSQKQTVELKPRAGFCSRA